MKTKHIPLPWYWLAPLFILNFPIAAIGLVAWILAGLFERIDTIAESIAYKLRSLVWKLAGRNTRGETKEQVETRKRHKQELLSGLKTSMFDLPELTEDSGKFEVKQWHYADDCPNK